MFQAYKKTSRFLNLKVCFCFIQYDLPNYCWAGRAIIGLSRLEHRDKLIVGVGIGAVACLKVCQATNVILLGE